MELELAELGGKAANLVKLRDAGFPVPQFVVLKTSEYAEFVAEHGLGEVIERARSMPADEASELIRAGFRREMSAKQRARIVATVTPLLGRPLAIRSSATAEDLPDASFAGQQDTFLNVRGLDAMSTAVVECWSSLWTERAISYRARNQVPTAGLGLAVIVQELVDAEASGVMFTADPLTGRRDRIVIEAVAGLGEQLVAGQVLPETFTIETATGEVLDQTHQGARPALSDGQLQELIQLGRRIAEHYGQPQDIEWTRVGDELAIVQSRPITSLYPLPAGPADALWLSFGGFQGMLDPISPLGADVLRRAMTHAAPIFGGRVVDHRTNPYLQLAGERLWVRFDNLLRGPAGNAVTKVLTIGDPAASNLLKQLAAEPEFAPRSIRGRRRIAATMARFVGPLAPRVTRGMLNPDATRARFTELTDRFVAGFALQLADATELSQPAARLATRMRVCESFTEQCFPVLLPAFGPFMGPSVGLLLRLRALARQTGLPDADELAMRVLRALPGNVTTEMDLALYAAAQTIATDADSRAAFERSSPDELAAAYQAGALPGPAQDGLAGFLLRYGMRGVAEIDLGVPRWNEEPAAIIGTIRSYLSLTADSAPDVAYERGLDEALAAIELIAAHLPTHKARQAGFIAGRLRGLFGARETPKFTIVRVLSLLRAALQASGDDLVEAGVLEHRDDVFLLQLGELGSAFEADGLRAAVRARRASRQRELRRTRVPIAMVGDGRTFYTGVLDGSGSDLAGSGVSPGVVEGPVRVVHDPRGSQLEPGEILVCRGTDPAWTPLFLTAGGLITEVGGLMTHGSVVAREYGLPAIVGVSEATHRLSTGQRVRLDGGAGTIVVLEGGRVG